MSDHTNSKSRYLMNSSFSHKGMNIDDVLRKHYPQAKIVTYALYGFGIGAFP
jgi:hypothetical protein